ncbi:protein PFC0760c-like, partial [Ceratina calcarata]|uniref:Protein PFC0760c-like n=1 Tax=Ceratina calcarata TaxID=156304 RepID=A0AAJ7S187_9HYME
NHYHRDQDCEWLRNSNCFLLNFTNVLQDIVSVLLNGTCVSDSISVISRFESINSIETVNDIKKLKKSLKNKSKNITRNYDRLLTQNSLKVANNHYVNDRLVFNNGSRKSVKGNKYQKNRIEYRWKRRTLCAVPDNGNQATGKLFDDTIFSNVKRETGERKTLSDYDRLDLLNNIDNSDSLVPHIRVKRNRLLFDPVSVYQQNYLKDLANSFPRNSYELVDENSYDDDASYDAKREIKSQEYFTNDQQLNAFSAKDQPKIRSVYPFTASVSIDEDKSDKSALVGDSKSNTIENKNRRSTNKEKYQDNVSLEEPSTDDVAVMKRRPYEDTEVQDIPEDSMLAVELVRKKRNNYAKIHNKKRATSDFQIERDERSATEEKESEAETENSEHNFNPSSLTVANLKAKLLRMRRKTKDSRREKKPKLKKKKKHVGKKHNSASNLQIRDVRLRDTDPSRVPRERKTTDAKSDGKSEVDIASIVAKKNIDNNFRGRSVKSKKSTKNTELENDPSKRNANLKLISKNKINTENSKRSASESDDAGDNNDDDDDSDDELGSDESPNTRQRQGTVKQGEESSEETKLRAKRNKYTLGNHGFLNKEEELRYYESIREPGSKIDEFSNQDENQLSAGNNVEPVRAIRSIEEVKELAKNLVSKVNELQNYLNIEEATGDEKDKKIEARAIDDLCSNVTSACDAFRESPKIVQKCMPSSHGFEPTAKVVERKINPVGSREYRLVKDSNKMLADQKRSLGSRRVVKMSGSSRMKKENGKKWGKWTDWSSCSVTCGKGRQIRWRYCLHDCSTAETEMEEKACQLPACPPKFLGIF